MYECHLTYEGIEPGSSEEEQLLELAQTQGWKSSYVTHDPVLGPGRRFFLTGHSTDLGYLASVMRWMVANSVLPPAREKIEHIVHDTKTGLVLP